MEATIKGISVEGTPAEMKEFLTGSPQKAVERVEKQVQEKPQRKFYRKHFKKKNGFKHWTILDLNLLKKRAGEGCSAKQIARELGRTKNAVQMILKRSKWKIAKNVSHKAWKTWTQTERDTILKEMTNGNTLHGIAGLLGRTEGAVYMEMKPKGYKLEKGFLVKDGVAQ